MRNTNCLLAAFTICVIACTSERPEFGQAIDSDAADAHVYVARDTDTQLRSDAGSTNLNDTSSRDDENSNTSASSSSGSAKKELGETCDAADECASRHCTENVEGEHVCCDRACDGVCQSCGGTGYCDVTPDDDATCEAIQCADDTACRSYPRPLQSNRCASFGQCMTAAAYCLPDTVDEGTSCGSDRACDGAGECQVVCPTHRGADRTCTAECPCDLGAGVCASDAQCQIGLVCATGGGAKYGLAGNTCLPAHCDNDMQDGAETSIDCGGECGCTATLEVLSDPLFVTGLSDDGSVVVGVENGAHVWRTGLSPEFLGDYWVYGVSGDGKVVFGTGDGGPVRWVNGGSPELLVSDNYSGGSPLSATRTGSTIVGVGRTADASEEGFIWTNGTTVSVAGFHSFGSISTDGIIVLGYLLGIEGQRGTPALWSATSGTTPLVVSGSWATMSRNGEYVLLQVTSGSPSPYVLLRRNETVTPLTAFGGTDEYLHGVSNDGVVIGRSGGNALYWSSETGYAPRLVEDLVRERGLEFDDVSFGSADLITPDGRTILGGNTDRVWRLRLH